MILGGRSGPPTFLQSTCRSARSPPPPVTGCVGGGLCAFCTLCTEGRGSRSLTRWRCCHPGQRQYGVPCLTATANSTSLPASEGVTAPDPSHLFPDGPAGAPPPAPRPSLASPEGPDRGARARPGAGRVARSTSDPTSCSTRAAGMADAAHPHPQHTSGSALDASGLRDPRESGPGPEGPPTQGPH